MKLTIVIPAHNEEENISQAVKRVEQGLKLEHSLVVVNDHSTDSTRQIVEGLQKVYPNISLVDNLKGPGFANAIKAGFDATTTEAVIPVMADSCDDTEIIRLMFDKLNDGYDVVCGSRYITGGARLGGSRLKGFLSSLAGSSLHYLLGIPTRDIANAFKMYRKKVIEAIEIESSGFEISMEIPLKAFYLGFRITELPTVWRERQKGKSSFKIFKLLPRYLKLYFWALRKRIS